MSSKIAIRLEDIKVGSSYSIFDHEWMVVATEYRVASAVKYHELADQDELANYQAWSSNAQSINPVEGIFTLRLLPRHEFEDYRKHFTFEDRPGPPFRTIAEAEGIEIPQPRELHISMARYGSSPFIEAL